jgi:hypothetical protein
MQAGTAAALRISRKSTARRERKGWMSGKRRKVVQPIAHAYTARTYDDIVQSTAAPFTWERY